MSASGRPEPEDELLAAELALRLLDADDSARAERRVRTDPAFAAAVNRWQVHLAELLERETGIEEPDGSVWERIAAAITRPSPEVEALRRSVRRWRGVAVAALSLAALFLALIVTRPSPPIVAPDRTATIVTLLSDEPGHAAGAIRYDPATRRLDARIGQLDTHGRTPVLWVIGGDGVPRSLGAGLAERTVPLETAAVIARGAKLAISLERSDAVDVATPAGPIVLSGQVL